MVAVLHEQAEVSLLLLQTGTGSEEDLRRAIGGNRMWGRILAPQAGPPDPTEGYLAVSPLRQVRNYRTSRARVPKWKDTVMKVCCRGHAEVFGIRGGCWGKLLGLGGRKWQETTGHYRTLQVTAAHYRTLQDTAGHCRKLQDNTGHYRALQVTIGH